MGVGVGFVPFLVQMVQLHLLILPLPSGASDEGRVTVYFMLLQWQLAV